MENKKLVGISLFVLVVLFMSSAYFYKTSQNQVSTIDRTTKIGQPK